MTPSLRRLPLLCALLVACSGLSGSDTEGQDTEGGTSGSLSCGASLSCAASEVCVRQDWPPVCSDRVDTGEPCPEGSTPTRCGGIGTPCCCEAAPDPTHACFDVSACADPVGCDCVNAACAEASQCAATADGQPRHFACEVLAMP